MAECLVSDVEMVQIYSVILVFIYIRLANNNMMKSVTVLLLVV